MLESPERVLEALDRRFGNSKVLVVGDLMLDRNLWGTVERISPEAPVPVVKLTHQTETPGGAANVAHNLAELSLQTLVAGYIGDDDSGKCLLDLLSQSRIDGEAVTSLIGQPTTTKTRVIGGHQQIVRVDTEDVTGVPSGQEKLLASTLEALDDRTTVLVLSDYAKGVLSDKVCRTLIDRAVEMSIPVLIDPKGQDYKKYSRATLLSPNRGELAMATGANPNDLDGLLSAGARLRESLSIEYMVVTLGELGMALIGESGVTRVPAAARDVFDVTGAGDTVIATIAACIADGLSMIQATQTAALAAGVVVGKVGTTPITKEELAEAIHRETQAGLSIKVFGSGELLSLMERWRSDGDKLVFTNGCFDLLHVGHVSLLERAKKLGDRLVVAINSDASVSRLKGESRPVVSQRDRAQVLAALESVDAVVVFEEDTPLNLVKKLRPNVLVKGSDYTEEEVVGAEEVRSWGGEVALIELVEGYSTTKLIELTNS